jgi:hypothetical protein
MHHLEDAEALSIAVCNTGAVSSHCSLAQVYVDVPKLVAPFLTTPAPSAVAVKKNVAKLVTPSFSAFAPSANVAMKDITRYAAASFKAFAPSTNATKTACKQYEQFWIAEMQH